MLSKCTLSMPLCDDFKEFWASAEQDVEYNQPTYGCGPDYSRTPPYEPRAMMHHNSWRTNTTGNRVRNYQTYPSVPTMHPTDSYQGRYPSRGNNKMSFQV